MKNETVANLMLTLKEKDMPKGLPEYSRNDLGYLLNTMWEESDPKCEDIKKALVTCCLRPTWFWKALEYSTSKPIKWVFKYPYEELPLLANRRSKYIKVVMKWRLKIGK